MGNFLRFFCAFWPPRRWYICAVACLLLIIFVLVPSSTVTADTGSTWMCWTSQWGDPSMVYAIDEQDYLPYLPGGSGPAVTLPDNKPWVDFAGKHPQSRAVAPFGSIAELIDVGHYFRFDTAGADLKILCNYDALAHRMRHLLTNLDPCQPGADPSILKSVGSDDYFPRTPWHKTNGNTQAHRDLYNAYRRVGPQKPPDPAAGDASRLTSFNGQWLDVDNPSGGVQRDDAQFLHDLVAGIADITIASRTAAHGGGRRITLVGTFPTITISSSTTVTCVYNGGSCSSSTVTRSEPDSVDLHFEGTDINNGEFFDTTFVASSQGREIQVPVGDGTYTRNVIPVDVSYIGSSTLQGRVGSLGAGYSFLSQRQVPGGDELHVNLTLDPTHRSDFGWYFGSIGPDLAVLPAFGTKPWSYTQHDRTLPGRYRDNLPVSEGPHRGFRRPVLDTVYPESQSGSTHQDPALTRVRWPANFEDLSWQIFSLPEIQSNSPDDQHWLLFNSPQGSQELVNSGFTTQGEPGQLATNCGYKGSGASRTDITCENLAGGNFFPFQRAGGGAGFSFASLLLVSAGVASPSDNNSGSLRSLNEFSFVVKESRVFSDTLASSSDPIAADRLGVPQHPEARADYTSSWPCVETTGLCASTPEDSDLDPNAPYLLVVAFYESRSPFTYEDSSLDLTFDGPAGGSNFFTVPKRQVRRVVCRLAVLPVFYAGAVDSETNTFVDALKKVGSAVGAVASIPGAVAGAVGGAIGEGLGVLLSGIFKAFAQGGSDAPPAATKEVSKAACGGLDELARATNGGPVEYEPPVTVEGDVLHHNAVADSVASGVETCQKVRVEEPVACSPSSGVVYGSSCVTLPSLELRVADVDFVSLEGGRGDLPADLVPLDPAEREGPSVNNKLDWYSFPRSTEGDDDVVNRLRFDLNRPFLGASFGQGSSESLAQAYSYADAVGADNRDPGKVENAVFEEVVGTPADTELPEGFNPHAFNSGLSLVRVEWDYRWHQDVSRDVYESIDGVKVSIAAGTRTSPSAGSEIAEFFLPREYTVKSLRGGDDHNKTYIYDLDGFWFGSMGMLPVDGGVNQELDGAIYRFPHSFEAAEPGDLPSQAFFELKAPASTARYVDGDHLGLNQHVLDMPVADGFNYRIWVTPYVGTPGKEGDPPRPGTASQPLPIKGATMACLARDENGEFEDRRIPLLYECQDGAAGASYAPPADVLAEAFSGLTLLNLTGTAICTDFLTATPSALTWDNSIVRSMWGFMWILAGAVFFVLLVWQGLRMTYDFGLDPRSSVGLREFIPRALLGLILAASSLYIIQMVLILAGDLTCLVGQYTGMSLWGIWGNVFGLLLDALIAFFQHSVSSTQAFGDAIGLAVAGFILGKITLMAILIVVLFIFIFILYVFGKVVFGLLIRLALLAVLIVFAPLAFVFYSSPNTSHWTNKWVTMFLGTVFQQVVVVIVLFVGLYFAEGYFNSTNADSLMDFVIAVVMAFAIFFLAGKVPDIVNPGSKGVFDGFGSLLMMAGAAALTVASAGVGFAAGFAGAGGSSSSGMMGMVRGGGGMRPPGGGVRAPGGGGGGGDDPPGGGSVNNGGGSEGQSGNVSTTGRRSFSPFSSVRSAGFNLGRRMGGSVSSEQPQQQSVSSHPESAQAESGVVAGQSMQTPSGETAGQVSGGEPTAQAAVVAPPRPGAPVTGGQQPPAVGRPDERSGQQVAPGRRSAPLPGQRDPGSSPPPVGGGPASGRAGQVPEGSVSQSGALPGAYAGVPVPVQGELPGYPGGPEGPPAPVAMGQDVGNIGFRSANRLYPDSGDRRGRLLAQPSSLAGLPGAPYGPHGPPAPGMPGGPEGRGPDGLNRTPPGRMTRMHSIGLGLNRDRLGLSDSEGRVNQPFDNNANVDTARQLMTGGIPGASTRGAWSVMRSPGEFGALNRTVVAGRPLTSSGAPVSGVGPRGGIASASGVPDQGVGPSGAVVPPPAGSPAAGQVTGSGPGANRPSGVVGRGQAQRPGSPRNVVSGGPESGRGRVGPASPGDQSPSGMVSGFRPALPPDGGADSPSGSESETPSAGEPRGTFGRRPGPSLSDRFNAGMAGGRAGIRRSQEVNGRIRSLLSGNFAYPSRSPGGSGGQGEGGGQERRGQSYRGAQQQRPDADSERTRALTNQMEQMNETLNKILDSM